VAIQDAVWLLRLRCVEGSRQQLGSSSIDVVLTKVRGAHEGGMYKARRVGTLDGTAYSPLSLFYSSLYQTDGRAAYNTSLAWLVVLFACLTTTVPQYALLGTGLMFTMDGPVVIDLLNRTVFSMQAEETRLVLFKIGLLG
jgi:hypothetical protein